MKKVVGMNILSLFDGISCARVAIGNKVKTYYASEIDPYAIKVAKKNFPDTIQLGDVTKIKAEHIKHPIDLLIGGSPCQDLSQGNRGRDGLKGSRSKLFWEYVRLLQEIKPKYFVFENVASMTTTDRDIITKALGVEPIMINASLVSAQCRKRLFWTNIKNVKVPDDRGIKLRDIIETPIAGQYRAGRSMGRRLTADGVRADDDKTIPIKRRIETRKDEKCGTLTGVLKDNLVIDPNSITRYLTPLECERLQSLPDNYTDCVSKTQRYKGIRNGFNVEVVKHILSFI